MLIIIFIFTTLLFIIGKGYKKNLTPAPQIKSIDLSFQWEKTKPRPIRPFHGKRNFKVSMGISNLAETPEDWLLIEDTYLKTVELRKSITRQYPKNTVHVHDSVEAGAAMVEFYEKVVNFLVQRYPREFIIKEGKVYNTIVNEFLLPSTADPKDLALSLAGHIEEDFLLLLKDDPTDLDEEYKLRASLTGFPAGFDPKEGHNKPISFIHKPVPQYPSRLKFSMAKFFNRLEPKDLWVRHNWSIQTHTQKFSLSHNHASDGEEVKELAYEDIDFENSCFLRVERQILSRLPKLRANFMTVRTFFTPIAQIKEEGYAEELCFAIDSLPDDLAHYKRRGAWGEAVKRYLRE